MPTGESESRSGASGPDALICLTYGSTFTARSVFGFAIQGSRVTSILVLGFAPSRLNSVHCTS